MICDYCDELILPGERADNKGGDYHVECIFRAVAGSIAHINRECSCYRPGSTSGDPPGMTLREAAKAALARYRELNPPQSITCSRCGRTSHNPNDVREGYCGNCHDWTSPKEQ